jgi:predicted transcriptional regulator
MNPEELQEAIAAKRSELAEIQAAGKATERELQERRAQLAARKTELMDGVQARMDLVEMLRRDIIRMANEESARVAQQEFDHPLPPLKK